MDYVTATNEFAGLSRVGTAALRQLMEDDDKLCAEVAADLRRIDFLIDSLDQVATRIRDKASNPHWRFA